MSSTRACILVLAVFTASCGGGSNTPTGPSQNTTPPPAVQRVSLTGTVSEQGGPRLSGATVRISDGLNAGQSTTTNGNGEYRFDNLQVSNANVFAEAPNYDSTGSGVHINGTNTLNFSLRRAGPRTSFGAGTYRVGTDIAAGRYFTNPADGCFWERLRGFSGSLSDVIANEFVSFNAAQWIVEIAASDAGFSTDSDCSTWTTSPQAPPPANTITPGLWLVGDQVAPGTYTANASSGCYWERRSDFSGTLNGTLANDFMSSAGQAVVTIRSSDRGFQTDGDCGNWTRASGLTADRVEPSPNMRVRNREMNRQQHGRR